MIYDKECEADENKIWIKDEIEPQQTPITQGYTALSYQNANAKQRKRKERNTSFQIIELHMNLWAHCM